MDEFEALLEGCRVAVERFVKFRLNSREDAEDVLQEVYLKAYRSFGQLKNVSSFKPWILSIARNKCNDYYRCAGKQEIISLEEVPELAAAGEETSPVADTMALLPGREREILELYYWQELPQSRIAQMLGIPLGTVKSRLHTAKNHFRARYPYPPNVTKGETIMGKLPEYIPDYTIEWLDEKPFTCKWEELLGWFIVPRLGEKLRWGMYDFPARKRTEYTEMEVVGKAEVHGIEGVEIVAVQQGAEDAHGTGCLDKVERRFVAQLTDTHSRYLAETHLEDGVRKCYTFLDGEDFLDNWGFGEDNCGNEINLAPRGLLKRQGSRVEGVISREVVDVAGRCRVTIGGMTYDTICVMDVECFNEAVACEQYIDRNGRTILWRRFNHDRWAMDRLGGKPWSEKLPDNERLTINGETYVHWYDCITDYIL